MKLDTSFPREKIHPKKWGVRLLTKLGFYFKPIPGSNSVMLGWARPFFR